MSADPSRPPDWLTGDAELVDAAAKRRDQDFDVGALVPAEQSRVTLAQRILAVSGRRVTVAVVSGAVFRGEVVEVGPSWVSLRDGADDTWVSLAAVVTLAGGGQRSGPGQPAQTVAATTVWRDWALQRRRVHWGLVDGGAVTGSVIAVGRDFLDVARHPVDRSASVDDARIVIALAAVAWATTTLSR